VISSVVSLFRTGGSMSSSWVPHSLSGFCGIDHFPLSYLLSSLLFFFFFLSSGGKKIEKNLFQSWVPSATVTQDTGAKIFESNFISRIEYIKTSVTTHNTQGEKKKTSVPSQKVTVRGPSTSILVPQVCGQITPKTHTETPTL
jgi:hypothetical protein